MAKLQQQNNLNKTAFLAAATTAALILFSFFGAPFVRVLSASVKSITFWFVGTVFVALLFVFNFSIASVYVGAVWMTLGLYSEFEKRGINWKPTSLLAILAGFFFTIISLVVKSNGRIEDSSAVKDLLQPMQVALKNIMTEEEFYKLNIIQYLPGIFLATLVTSLAISFIFESRIFELFRLQQEKIASSVKWIEFRTPDLFIWISLFGYFFSLINFEISHLKIISINISIFTATVFFFQGIAVMEYLNRFYRVGRFTKMAVYLLVFGWMGPGVCLVGLLDYWVDFRKKVRKKIK